MSAFLDRVAEKVAEQTEVDGGAPYIAHILRLALTHLEHIPEDMAERLADNFDNDVTHGQPYKVRGFMAELIEALK